MPRCVAKQTLKIANRNGNAIESSQYDQWLAAGGNTVGNVNALVIYEYEKIADNPYKSQYYVKDDLYNGKNLEMSMNKRCFEKYFLPVD
jgi:hypothetical protein